MMIVKIGGGETLNLAGIVQDLATLDETILIVHGANVLRDSVALKMGYTKQVLTSVKGYTSVFSDHEALDAILMAYSGLRNKRLVELCQQNGINAVGLTGLDGRIVQGKRNSGIRVVENGRKMLKRDLSGKPREVNDELLCLLMDNGYTPVLTIPIADETGTAINTENDDVVCQLQQSLQAKTVVQLIEAPGFLANADDDASLIKEMSAAELDDWEQSVTGRMKRKIHALNKLAGGDVERIIISDGRGEHPIQDALAGSGTWIRP